MEPTLSLSTYNYNDLLETTKWAKFMAIVGFVMCGLMVLLGFGMSAVMSIMPNGDMMTSQLGSSYFIGMGFFYVVFSALYFFPCWYLYKFAKSTKYALLNEDSDQLDDGFMNMRKMFKFVGIMTLVVMIIYAVLIVFAIGGVGIAAMMS